MKLAAKKGSPIQKKLQSLGMDSAIWLIHRVIFAHKLYIQSFMNKPDFTRPFYIFLLMFPSGISNGFLTVVMPYILSKNGFPLAVTAGIVAIGVSANLWRFLWGPVVDISLSIHKWFWIGVLSCTSTLVLLCFIPFSVKEVLFLSVVVFVSQVATTLTLLPVNAIMAKRISETEKGRVSGWYQAGHLAGTGIGGGAGLWIATNYDIKTAGLILGVSSILFALTIFLVRDIESNQETSLSSEIKILGKDILAMVKTPVTLLVMLLLVIPIGTGAMANLWSGLAKDWNTNAKTVVLVTGIFSGLVSALGSILGGFIADRWGAWIAYLGCAIICAIITMATAFLPFNHFSYIAGVLTYAFTMGMVYSGFTAVILFAIGKTHVTTKYSLLVSLGNLPAVYMTAFNGWVHDRFGSHFMLLTEAIAGFLFVFLFTLLLRYMMNKKLVPAIKTI